MAHHTSDVVKNINLAIKFLKKGGFFILGLGETNGFFQRNLQRYILYSLSSDLNEITSLSKELFKENLYRGKKYGGRSIKEIIYDTYINPKIETLSFKEITELFKKNNLYLYSADEDIFDLKKVHGYNKSYFRLIKKRKFEEKEFIFNSMVNFSYRGNTEKSLNKNFGILNRIFNIQSKITQELNDQSIAGFKKINLDKHLDSLKAETQKLEKIDIINMKNSIQFINELKKIFKILKNKNKKIKIKQLKIAINKNHRLFKGYNGKGMNYFVGMKL